jgi:DNA modification methylase
MSSPVNHCGPRGLFVCVFWQEKVGLSKYQPINFRRSIMKQIVSKETCCLKPYKNNARKHNDAQLEKIAASIKTFGFNNPILIDKEDVIIAGHGRWEAAKRIGLREVPTLCLDHLSEKEVRAYILADNKLAELAGWDNDILAIELQYLTTLDLEFDIEITGFETGEIDFIMEGAVSGKLDPADEDIEPDKDRPSITKTGDLWFLGNHKLYCGNSLEDESFRALLGQDNAQMVFTDPPYNVPIDGHVCGSGSIKHREFEMGVGEMTTKEFEGFLTQSFELMKKYSLQGSITFCCMDWRHMQEILGAGQKTGYEIKNLCVWVKDNGGMGSLYRSKHELVFVFKNGKSAHINNIQLGKNGRYRTNVWEYPGVNSLKKNRMEELAMHPTVKPINLVADAIKDCSKRQGIILDPFGGSGTTLLAAEKTGRQARLIELDPHYCDLIIHRWEKLTCKKAELKGE